MKNQNMFEIATKNKLRFPFKGLISTEDLWDLPLSSLDSIFKTLNAEMKKVSEESLLNVKTKEDETLEIKIEIVKHIANIKMEEAEHKRKAKEVKEQKQKILEVLQAKKDEALQNKTPEELEEMLKSLQS